MKNLIPETYIFKESISFVSYWHYYLIFTLFIDIIDIINKFVLKCPQVTTVGKKTLIMSLPYLGDISLQTKTKLKKSFKGILNFCKLQFVFKSQRKLANVFWFKDRLSSNLCLKWIINISAEGAILLITVRRIDVWKLGLENILGFRPRHLEKLKHQKRVKFVIISYTAIIFHHLTSLLGICTSWIYSWNQRKLAY